ncbi:MAG: hypothetical protein L0Y54_02100, partial [Sporichthyaceae bacterium]|nr:hypothetical protein [Sporichthyaceae bacterium]
MSETPGAGPAGAGQPPNSDQPPQERGQAPAPPDPAQPAQDPDRASAPPSAPPPAPQPAPPTAPGWSANQPPPAWAAPTEPSGAPGTGSGWTGPGPTGGSASGWSSPGGPASGWGSPGGPAGSGQPDGWGQPGGPPSGPAPAWAWSQQYAQQVKPGIIPLRPLGISELLDGAVSAIRANPAITLFMGAAVAVVSQTLVLIASYWLLSTTAPVIPDDPSFSEVVDALAVPAAALFVVVAASWLAGLLATGLLTIVVGRQVVARSITLQEAWSATWPRLWKLILLSVLQGLIIAAAVFVAFVPAFLAGLAGADGLA